MNDLQEKSKKIEFIADEIQIDYGKRVDKSTKITFIVGEYMKMHTASLIPMIGKVVRVTVAEEEI